MQVKHFQNSKCFIVGMVFCCCFDCTVFYFNSSSNVFAGRCEGFLDWYTLAPVLRQSNANSARKWCCNFNQNEKEILYSLSPKA